jgi:soluble lytic murein transglycosylase-like protein
MAGPLTAALLMAAAFAGYISEPAARPLPAGVCERYMAAAARRHGVPLPVLYAVGRTESGRGGRLHPWTLNVRGRAVYAKSRGEALSIARSLAASGERLFDIGCMQINFRYHGGNFASLWEMLDPARNVDYAARFLKRLHRRLGSWTLAAARYHAGPNNDAAQKRYVCAVIRNLVETGFGRWTPRARAFCRAPERLAGTER